jgi:rubrerythrin
MEKGGEMTDLRGSKSEKELLNTFAADSQANCKYLAFGKQAEREGYPKED